MCVHHISIMYPLGIGPWKLAMLSSCLLLWDIMWGKITPAFKEEWTIKVGRLAARHMIVSDRPLPHGRVLIGVYSGTRTMSIGRIAYARAGRPCATSVCTPVQDLLRDQARHAYGHKCRICLRLHIHRHIQSMHRCCVWYPCAPV